MNTEVTFQTMSEIFSKVIERKRDSLISLKITYGNKIRIKVSGYNPSSNRVTTETFDAQNESEAVELLQWLHIL